MEDLEKRKEAYGICGECGEPGTGQYWCQPCNAKRFKENFYLQIYTNNIDSCTGMNQNPDTKDYMMVLRYFEYGDLKNHLSKSIDIDYETKFRNLSEFADGLLDIHNAGKVHKDLHSGNV